MENQLWVEPVGNLIIARLRGVPTEAIIKECHQRVVDLVKETRQGTILYDGLEMEAPANDLATVQWALDEKLGDINLRRAIVVPNTRIAYLARLAFAEGNYRVFYNDMSAAILWLNSKTKDAEVITSLHHINNKVART